MKPTRARMPSRLRGTLFALSIAAMATQAGSAPLPLRVAHAFHAAHSSILSVSVQGERVPTPSLASLMHGAPVSESWALLLAGLTGILAIGRRRTSALGSLSFDPQGLRRR